MARPANLVIVRVTKVKGKAALSGHAGTVPASTPQPPFTECPAVGNDTSCGILVQITNNANNVIGDASQGPYDGSDDTLIGVLNSSSDTIGSVQLSSDSGIFAFDGDGLCTQSPAPAGCPFGPTGYEGSGTAFSGITSDATGGVVNFSPALAPGATAYFSLEEPLTSTTVTAGGPTAGEQGGPVNLSENPTTCSTAEPVNCATGVFWHTFTDLSVPGRGMALNFSRTYSSAQAATDGPLGFGWTDSYNLALTTDASGDVTISQEDGSTITFQPNGSGGFAAPPRVLATLTQNTDGSFTFIRDRGMTEYNFSASGQLTREVDRNGYQTQLAYNSSGQLSTVTDPAGRTLAFTYSGSHIASVTDPLGRTWTYSYDASGNLVSATDPMNRTWSFTYDSSHQLLTLTDPRGGATTNTYNASGQVTSQTDAAGRTTTWSFSGDPSTSAGSTTTMTDPNGNVTTYAYSDFELTSETRAATTSLAATTSYTYDPVTLGVATITDPNGNVTTNTYDISGNLLSTTNPLGNTTSYSYNSFNEMLTKTTPLGETTSYSYDASGNLLSITDAIGNTTSYAYSDTAHPGDVTSITDAGGNVTSYTYDADGDVASVSVSPSAGLTDTTTYAYDADGERTCMASPIATSGSISCPAAGSAAAAGTTATSYNADGEVTSVTDPDGGVTTYAYDPDGNKVQVTNPAGQVTSYTYNADNEQTNITRADGSTLSDTYDADGNLTSQTGPAGQVTTYVYNALSELGSITDPLGRTTSYGYDADGNRTTVTDPSGRVTTYAYDQASELTGITYSDGVTPNVSYTYDADGQRATMTDGTGTTSYSYDSDGHVTSVTDGSGAMVSYTYDPNGRVTAVGYPSGQTVTRTYDGAGQLTSVGDWLGNTTKFSYDADGNLTGIAYPNGVTATSSFDPADRLTSISDKTATATLATFAYTRNNLGEVTTAAQSGAAQGTASYSYTQLSQLGSDGGGTYSYDPAGDLTGQPGSITQAYNAASELTSSTQPGTVRPPATDRVGAANETVRGSKITSHAITTRHARELVLAFISAGGPAKSAQSVTSVTGGGLAWKLVARADARQGTAEVWQASTTTALKSATITAALKDKGYDGSITVATFTGASSSAGAHATASGSRGAPAVSLTTTGPDSLIWAAGEDPSRATARTAAAGQTVVHQFLDAAAKSTDWSQATGPIPATATKVKIADTAPTSDKWNLAAVEITAAAPGTEHISYSYDKEGDLTTISPAGQPGTTLTYDQAGRLVGYGASATYAYDGDGLRASKTVSGTTTAYSWDRSGPLPLLIAAGATSYIDGPGGLPVEQIAGSTPAYLLSDGQGSTRLLTGPSGNVTGTYSYRSYGEITSHTGATTALEFDGQYADQESGLQYLRARYYDPATGQFLTQDPLLAETGQAHGFAGDNPVNAADPTGLSWYNPFSWSNQTWTAIGVGAAFVGVGLLTFGAGDLVVGSVGLSYLSVTSIETEAFTLTEISAVSWSADITLGGLVSAVGSVATAAGLARSTWDTLSACYSGSPACGLDAGGVGLDLLSELLIGKYVPAGVLTELANEAAGDLSLGYDLLKDWLLEHDKSGPTCAQ